MTARENPKAPHNQPFNITGKKNKTKVRSWWCASSSTYWVAARKKHVKANEED